MVTKSSTLDKAKEAGWGVLGCVAYIVMAVVGLILFFLLVEYGAPLLFDIMPILAVINGIGVVLGLLILPFALIPKARNGVAVSLQILAMIFWVSVWVYAFLVTYYTWGIIGLVIGVLIAGVGVVITGILSSLLAGEWSLLGNLILAIVIPIVTSVIGAAIASKAPHSTDEHLESSS